VGETPSSASWVSEYDYPNRQVSLTLADPGLVGHHWSGLRKDQSLSDPGGDFDVLVADRRLIETTAEPVIVKIVARLDEEGDLRNPHPDFISTSIGSLTLWPYKRAGQLVGAAHWIWWVQGDVFRRQPRPWQEVR
jgi:hypothetical protein